ncbi:Pentatricopeptide repeat-containing protein [Raphanus sativus]|uniref:Pentatricopeptide repeat-containing protein At5g18475 n=1 Tax=Raphanus sativus TaxID=3726 RepID=A0A6J0MC11_RAPSA|nr:pentatricopeptide repeat-containing protein At5g18475 [Raphanus sativus]KAJ4910676.1 Pentatricopeptide repeat-containing protein [Raphanus sativus]
MRLPTPIINESRRLSSSSRSWISPISLTSKKKPDPPPESSISLPETTPKPQFISHESAVNLIKRERDPQRALDIFNRASQQKGFNHNSATYSVLLDNLVRRKKFNAVDAVLHQMKHETCRFQEALFLNLMRHFSRFEMHGRVVEMFGLIQVIARVKPSLNAVSTCLNLLVDSKEVGLAKKLLLYGKERLGLQPNTCIFNILVKHHCMNGDVDSAFGVVEEMKRSGLSYPNLITYSTLMECLFKHSRCKEAMELFEDMISKEGISPDPVIFNVMINGFCRAGEVERGKMVIEFMKKNGCNPNVYNYSALMNGFCKEGKIQEAREVFEEVKETGLKLDTVGYTTLMNCFSRSGQIDEAMELLGEMKASRCRADALTYNVILRGLCSEGRTEEALEMLSQWGCEGVHLNKGSYRIILNALCKNGELEKAVGFLSLMSKKGVWPHHATWNELVVRLCGSGNADIGVRVLTGFTGMGFKPEPESWRAVVQSLCKERKLLHVFELLDSLVS